MSVPEDDDYTKKFLVTLTEPTGFVGTVLAFEARVSESGDLLFFDRVWDYEQPVAGYARGTWKAFMMADPKEGDR